LDVDAHHYALRASQVKDTLRAALPSRLVHPRM
jgi:hypothetical protein